MINESKPVIENPQTYLNVGSGFSLLVGNTFRLIVGALGAGGGLINSAKVSTGETWATISTSWATEPRTWEAVSQLISNSARVSSAMTNQAKPI